MFCKVKYLRTITYYYNLLKVISFIFKYMFE